MLRAECDAIVAGHPAREGVVASQLSARVYSPLVKVGGSVQRAGRRLRFTLFQWAICILLVGLSAIIGLTLISIRDDTVELNASVRENTRALTDMKASVASSVDGIDRKLADTNQKLFDMIVEVDNLVAEQNKLQLDLPETSEGRKQKSTAKMAATPREETRTSALTVHRHRIARDR